MKIHKSIKIAIGTIVWFLAISVLLEHFFKDYLKDIIWIQSIWVDRLQGVCMGAVLMHGFWTLLQREKESSYEKGKWDQSQLIWDDLIENNKPSFKLGKKVVLIESRIEKRQGPNDTTIIRLMRPDEL